MGGAGAVETDQTLLGDCAVILTVDISDPLMSQRGKLIHQLVNTFGVIGKYGSPVVKDMVDCDDRQVAVSQLNDLRVIELDAGSDHAVNAAVAAVL